MKKYCIILVLLVIAPFLCKATDYYADPSSVSATEDGSITNPWKSVASINSNMNLLSGGGNLYLKKGEIFIGTINIYHSGTVSTPITISSYGSSSSMPKLYPNLSDGVLAKDRKLILLSGVNYVVINGIQLDDNNITDINHTALANVAYGIYSYQSNYCTFQNLAIARVGMGVAIESNYNKVQNCTIQNLRMVVNDAAANNDYGAVGVLIMGANNTVTGNTIKDCWGASQDYIWDGGAVEIFGNGTNMPNNNDFLYNTAINNEGWMELGSSNAGTCTNVKSAYNLLINNGRLCWLNLGGAFTLTIDNLQFYNNCVVETDVMRSVPIFEIGCYPAATGSNVVVLKNNIFWFRTSINITDPYTNYFPAGSLVHQNNLYRLGSGGLGLGYTAAPSENTYTGVQNFFTDTSNALPELWNYYPKVGAPQIDFGQNVGINFDFNAHAVPYGTNTDAGILEFSSVVPVVLANFSVTENGCVAHIKWATEAEENFKEFELQTSTDGINFYPIAVMKPKGNKGVYFYDQKLYAYRQFFRLKMIDLDEKYSFSSTIASRQNCGLPNATQVFPNPVKSKLFIQGIKTPSLVGVYDNLGRLIKQFEVANENELKFVDVSALPKGVYCIKMGYYTQKFIKE